MSIKVKLPIVYEHQLNDNDVQREIMDIEDFINENEFEFSKDTMNFVLIKGFYSHVKRTMVVIGVFINKTEFDIFGIKSDLELEFNNQQAEIAMIKTNFPPEFVGALAPEDGLLVHIEVPVKGLESDDVFTIEDISGALNEIELIRSEN